MNTSLPTLMISENEGEFTAKYHKIIAESMASHPDEVFIFIPRTSDELNAIYEHFKSGKVTSKYLSPLKSLWNEIEIYIKDELTTRTQDRQKPILDEFLAAFNDFLKIIKDFHDQSFFETFYGKYGLTSKLQGFCLRIQSYLDENPDLTWEMLHVPYTVSKINEMLIENGHFDFDLNEFFQTFCLSDDYKNSPEYKQLNEIVLSIFEEGIPLNFPEEKSTDE